MKTNHWGVIVDSETPVTGVLNTNAIAFEWIGDETCLTCEEIIAEGERAAAEAGEEFDTDYLECDGSHTRIIGDWVKDADGKYAPDKNGEFAAIVGEVYTQVVFSKTTERHALCAPTYPGQADLDSEGDFLAYTLPANLLEH